MIQVSIRWLFTWGWRPNIDFDILVHLNFDLSTNWFINLDFKIIRLERYIAIDFIQIQNFGLLYMLKWIDIVFIGLRNLVPRWRNFGLQNILHLLVRFILEQWNLHKLKLNFSLEIFLVLFQLLETLNLILLLLNKFFLVVLYFLLKLSH